VTEYLSEALVLAVYPNGDRDWRVSLFTKKFGKLVAKAKSARKITSKLAGHIQPGNIIRARLVEKGGLQVVDALKSFRLCVLPSDLYFLDRLVAEAEPDLELWQALAGRPNSAVRGSAWVRIDWRKILKILGWDPAAAVCRVRLQSGQECRKPPAYFYLRDQEFFCKGCSLKFNAGELISLE
jgi:recombinational DNA repair protein (RecF pathway)